MLEVNQFTMTQQKYQANLTKNELILILYISEIIRQNIIISIMIPSRQPSLSFSSNRRLTKTYRQNCLNQCYQPQVRPTTMPNTYCRKIDFNKIVTSSSTSNSINSLHSISEERFSINSKYQDMPKQKRSSASSRKCSIQSRRSQYYERDSLIGLEKPIMRNIFIGLFILFALYFILTDQVWNTLPTDNVTEKTLHLSETENLYLILLQQMKQTEDKWISLKKFHEKYFVDVESWDLLILKIAQSPQCEVKKVSKNTQNEDQMISCFNKNL